MIVYNLVLLQSLLLDRWSLLRAADPWRTPGSDPTGTLSFTSIIFIALPKKKVGMTYIDASYIDDVSLWGLHYWVIQWQWIRKLVSQWASSFVSQVEWGLFSLSECSTFYESLHVPQSPVFFWEAEHNSVSKVNYLKVDKVKWREWWAVN